MDAILVRQAVLADLDLAADLLNQFRILQGRAADLPAVRAFLLARFDHGESVVYLALDGETAVGFAQLYPSFSSTALARVMILNDLFVTDAGRRKGVASRLLAAVEAHAWTHGSTRVSLNVMRTNTAGQALYEARGWTQDADHFMYHRFPDPAGR